MNIKYVIGHHTGGALKPNALDLVSYQLLIDGEGKRKNGLPIGATASTGGMNSITYNIACCGGLASSKLTKVQIEAFYKACAEKLKEYGLTPKDFYTHAEIGEMARNYQNKQKGISLKGADCNGKLITDLLPYNNYLYQNVGKIDLTVLPNISGSAKVTGSAIRAKIQWYFERL